MKRLLPFALLFAGCTLTKPVDPCDPNPCTTENRNVCVANSGQAQCLCNEGYLPRPTGACEAVGAGNCPEHSGDAAEPDDCLLKAAALPAGSTRSQSIDPPGDYDFFSFDAAEKNVYAVDVKPSGALYPRVDLFDANGAWLTSAEHAGDTHLAFRVGGAGTYYFRVAHSPLDPSVGTGTYTVGLSALGPEDFGDSSAEATSLTPSIQGQTVAGGFLYPNDQDWFAFNVTTTVAYRITFDASRAVPQVAIYYAGKLTTPILIAQQASFEFSFRAVDLGGQTNGRVFLVLYAPATLGGYSFVLTSSG